MLGLIKNTCCILILIFITSRAVQAPDGINIVVIISANAEWQPIRELFTNADIQNSPFGEWFTVELEVEGKKEQVIFFHGGWGKISAAASAQYVIDRWSPVLLINLGTCGGFEGEVYRDETILADRTIVYDIIEQMGDSEEAITFYSTDIDLSWLTEPYPIPVRRSLLVSADRDLVPEELKSLKEKYGVIAGDWESGAIAWVAKRNSTHCLILRTVSDLVSTRKGEVYGNIETFRKRTRKIMKNLVESLPGWISRANVLW